MKKIDKELSYYINNTSGIEDVTIHQIHVWREFFRLNNLFNEGNIIDYFCLKSFTRLICCYWGKKAQEVFLQCFNIHEEGQSFSQNTFIVVRCPELAMNDFFGEIINNR